VLVGNLHNEATSEGDERSSLLKVGYSQSATSLASTC